MPEIVSKTDICNLQNTKLGETVTLKGKIDTVDLTGMVADELVHLLEDDDAKTHLRVIRAEEFVPTKLEAKEVRWQLHDQRDDTYLHDDPLPIALFCPPQKVNWLRYVYRSFCTKGWNTVAPTVFIPGKIVEENEERINDQLKQRRERLKLKTSDAKSRNGQYEYWLWLQDHAIRQHCYLHRYQIGDIVLFSPRRSLSRNDIDPDDTTYLNHAVYTPPMLGNKNRGKLWFSAYKREGVDHWSG